MQLQPSAYSGEVNPEPCLTSIHPITLHHQHQHHPPTPPHPHHPLCSLLSRVVHMPAQPALTLFPSSMSTTSCWAYSWISVSHAWGEGREGETERQRDRDKGPVLDKRFQCLFKSRERETDVFSVCLNRQGNSLCRWKTIQIQ